MTTTDTPTTTPLAEPAPDLVDTEQPEAQEHDEVADKTARIPPDLYARAEGLKERIGATGRKDLIGWSRLSTNAVVVHALALGLEALEAELDAAAEDPTEDTEAP